MKPRETVNDMLSSILSGAGRANGLSETACRETWSGKEAGSSSSA